jgi:hypothetical protein
MHDDDTIRGEVDVQLQAVRARRHADIERGNRVFGTEVAAAPVCKHLRAVRKESAHEG